MPKRKKKSPFLKKTKQNPEFAQLKWSALTNLTALFFSLFQCTCHSALAHLINDNGKVYLSHTFKIILCLQWSSKICHKMEGGSTYIGALFWSSVTLYAPDQEQSFHDNKVHSSVINTRYLCSSTSLWRWVEWLPVRQKAEAMGSIPRPSMEPLMFL